MSHVNDTSDRRGRLRRLGMALLVGALAVSVLPGVAEAAKSKKKKKKKAPVVKVMTRNLYLGADLGPGLEAESQVEFVDAAGQIVNQVDRTNFPLRSKALAQEILTQSPDVVGLQEVAWWRTGPVRFDVTPPKATQTEYNWLDTLLADLGGKYKLVIVKDEFDFESPVNDQGPPGGGADRNARFTQRDAILVRTGKRVKVTNPSSGTFNTLLRVTPAGQQIDVTRGWTAATIHVGRAKPFRLVNLHFEAFDSDVSNNSTNLGTTVGKGQVRQAQAQQLTGPGGPAGPGGLPVVLVGDLNSDDDTVAMNGDHLAYTTIVANGFRPVDTSNPMSCCLDDPELTGGNLAAFDHHIDHVMTNSQRIRFIQGFVTGLAKVNGFQPSDHAGVTSVLRMPAKKKGKKKGGKKK